MSSTNFWAIGSGSDPWAAGRRPFMARDRVFKCRKMMKIGSKPTQNGVGGASNPDILQGRGRIDHLNALPIACDPVGVFKITFFLEKNWSYFIEVRPADFERRPRVNGWAYRGPQYGKMSPETSRIDHV